MAVFTEQTVRDNLRNRDGKRVFYLADGDHLTPSAREWLRRERIEILRAEQAKPSRYRTLSGSILLEKSEHMTHLYDDVLVPKDHPRIVFRGWVDRMQAELLLAEKTMKPDVCAVLEEVLSVLRTILACDVLDKPLELPTLYGRSMEQIRQQSHFPQNHFDQPHFMPSAADDESLLQLNRLRALSRQVELAACYAFQDRDGNVTRPDIVQALNRISSVLYLLMIQQKKEQEHGKQPR